MQTAGTVERIILTTDGRDGAVYAIALCANGALVVTRNGEFIDDAEWDRAQMDDCVAEFARRSGLDGDSTR